MLYNFLQGYKLKLSDENEIRDLAILSLYFLTLSNHRVIPWTYISLENAKESVSMALGSHMTLQTINNTVFQMTKQSQNGYWVSQVSTVANAFCLNHSLYCSMCYTLVWNFKVDKTLTLNFSCIHFISVEHSTLLYTVHSYINVQSKKRANLCPFLGENLKGNLPTLIVAGIIFPLNLAHPFPQQCVSAC